MSAPPLVIWTIAGSAENVYSIAYILITFFCMAAAVGPLAAVKINHFDGAPRSLNDSQKRTFTQMLIVLFAVSMVSPVVFYFLGSQQFGSYNLLTFPQSAAVARYTASWSPPSWFSLLRSMIYILASISGFVWSCQATRKHFKYLTLIWIVPATITFYLEASRMSLVYPTIFWIGSMSSGIAYFGNNHRLTIKRIATICISLALIAYPFVYAGFVLRNSTMDNQKAAILADKSNAALFGFITVLGKWADSRDLLRQGPDKDLISASGISQIFGNKQRAAGVYESGETLDQGSDSSFESNVFTGLRVFIDDFGLIGALLVVAFWSIAGSIGWYLLRSGYSAGYFLSTGFAANGLCMPVMFLYIYNSSIACLVASSILIYYVLRPRRANA